MIMTLRMGSECEDEDEFENECVFKRNVDKIFWIC